eukprot:1926958-Rhodomonas_salina.2
MDLPLPGTFESSFNPVSYPTRLRACYAMSGTDLACFATSLRACCAMFSTYLAYAATRPCPPPSVPPSAPRGSVRPIVLRPR